MLYSPLKRAVDIICSALGLLILSPLMIWISVRIKSEMGPPAVFSQMRTGRGGRLFRLYKFRTMTGARDERGELLPDADRLTGFGKWLRSTSLDELPQLWNVLKGDISLVGPRPLLPEYLSLYNEAERKRLDVPQGITGWAQINGRNAISWQQKFALDAWYVDNRSLTLDMKIIFSTIKKALKKEGISAAGEATMPRFTGSGESAGGGQNTE